VLAPRRIAWLLLYGAMPVVPFLVIRELGLSIVLAGSMAVMLLAGTRRSWWAGLMLAVWAVLVSSPSASTTARDAARARIEPYPDVAQMTEPEAERWAARNHQIKLFDANILAGGLTSARGRAAATRRRRRTPPTTATSPPSPRSGAGSGPWRSSALHRLRDPDARVAVRERSAFERSLVTGLAMLIAIPFWLATLGGIRVIPLTGVAAAFAAHGGAKLLATAAAVGLIAGISHRRAEEERLPCGRRAGEHPRRPGGPDPMSDVVSHTVELHGLRFEIGGVSEQGPRSENQDAFSTGEFARTGIVAVADGMGGELGGRMAADLALRVLEEHGPIRSFDEARRAVRAADATIARTAEQNPGEHGGMGCALGVLALTANHGDGINWIAAHVGDVRILSRPRTGRCGWRRATTPPPSRAGRPARSRSTSSPTPRAPTACSARSAAAARRTWRWLPARPGWSWLLVSDGIYKAMRLDELQRAMEAPTAADACEVIRRKVEERGPDDNYTAVLIRALADGRPAAAAAPRRAEMSNPQPVKSRGPRTGWLAALSILVLAALALAGLAFWSAREAGLAAAERTEIERLRSEVDSLRIQVQELREPFGPSAEPPIAVPGAAPAPRTPTQP
jgi:serine/threonine protein phosphatase PrpC